MRKNARVCSLPNIKATRAAREVLTAVRQIAAQSISRAMQRAIILTSATCKHAVEQRSHASAHALHASRQAWLIW